MSSRATGDRYTGLDMGLALGTGKNMGRDVAALGMDTPVSPTRRVWRASAIPGSMSTVAEAGDAIIVKKTTNDIPRCL